MKALVLLFTLVSTVLAQDTPSGIGQPAADGEAWSIPGTQEPPPPPPTPMRYQPSPPQSWAGMGYRPSTGLAPIKTLSTCRKHWDYYIKGGQKETVYADEIPAGMTAGDVLEARLQPRGLTVDWPSNRKLLNTYPAGYPPTWHLPMRLQPR